jgi:DNA-binding IclR family transcriptional regulator
MVDWPDERIRAQAPGRRGQPTERTIASAEALLAEVQRMRTRGCGRSHDERQIGVSGVAAYVSVASGAVVAPVGIMGPTSRLAPDLFDPPGARAVEGAARISVALGHRGAAG